MKKHFLFLFAFLILELSVLACSSSFKLVGTPAPASEPGSTQTAMPVELLPQTLYYMGTDDAGLLQIFRLERDGKTVRQITHESVAAGRYDVSLVDGSVAYVANNQLLLINADGSGRRVLVDGGLLDPNNPQTSLHHPAFSPNGKTIAFAFHGLSLYNLATGESRLIVPDELYRPEKYSPDGSKLLLTVSVPNSDATHDVIYDLATNSIVNFNYADGAFFCCGREVWDLDSLSLYDAYAAMGILTPGLWKVDAASGHVTTLIPSEVGNESFNLAAEPYLAPDGQLYYFYAKGSLDQAWSDRAPLQIVRAAPDGVTGRVVLRPEIFESLSEALWAPDAGFVIVGKSPADSTRKGSSFELYYTDASKSMIPLLPAGLQLQWGP